MAVGRRDFGTFPVAFAALVSIVFALSSLPVVTAGPTLGSTLSTPSEIPVDAAAVYSGTFAARAGYESGYVESVSDAVPALGQQLAVVTFRPSSPSFFTPPPTGAPALSLTQIANLYGLPPEEYASAETYFESMGLTIAHTNPTRLSLTVSGSAAEVGSAFGTALESGSYEGREVTFPSTPPSLPPGLESSVSAVTGLSSGFDTFALPVGLSGPAPATQAGPEQGPDLITPAIAREIYDLSSLYNVSGSSQFATGEGVVLLLWGDGYSPNDLSTFFSSDYPSSFPKPNLQPFPVDGAPMPSSNAVNDPSKAPQELTLDIEWSGSMAPGATLDAVYAPDGPESANYSPTDASMADALTEAVTGIPGVSVISMSFGTPENESSGLQTAWATDFATAAHEGITLLAATGDLGGDYAANCQGGPSLDYPASSPDVIAVGGTDPVLARNLLGQVTGLQSESAWSGSSGGFSTVFSAPSWEKVGSAAAPIEAHGGARGTPDVSAAATYNYLYYNGQDGVAAGTSFATPLWGGLVAEMDALYGQKLGFLTPRLYAVGASQEAGAVGVGLGDVTGGTTCIGTAGPGWDPESGWGSPRAKILYEDLTATFVNLTVSASPTTVAPGGTVRVVAQLSNRTSGVPISGVAVAVSLQATTSDGPCTGVWGSENIPSNATGFVSLSVTVPACFLGSHASAQVSVTSDGLYGTNSTTIAVNLLAFIPGLEGVEQYPQNVVAFVLIMGIAAAIGYAIGRKPSRPPPSRPAAAPPPAVPSAASPPSAAPPNPYPPAAPPPSPPGPS